MSSLLRVFVSSTSTDLVPYRDAAMRVILEEGWLPVMMEHFQTMTEPTVETCRRLVGECDLVLLILAFRWGAVPGPKQGGNGRLSFTAWEVDAARKKRIPVRALLARTSWPGHLWDDNPKDRQSVIQFRNTLNRAYDEFDHEPVVDNHPEPLYVFRGKVRQALLKHRDELYQQAVRLGSPPIVVVRPVGAEVVLPSLEEYLTRLMLPHEDLLRAYERTAPRGWEPAPADFNPILFLVHCIRSLAKAPRQGRDGPFPLLRFVEELLLLEKMPPEASAVLRDWLRQAATDVLAPPLTDEETHVRADLPDLQARLRRQMALVEGRRLEIEALDLRRGKPRDQFLAIHWGTTNTCAAYSVGVGAQTPAPTPVLFDREQRNPEQFPSDIYFVDLSNPDNPVFLIGFEAVERGSRNPECLLRSVKRKFQFREKVTVLDERQRARVYPVEVIVRLLLHRLITQAEVTQKQEFHGFGLTFPTKWSPRARQRLEKVARELQIQLRRERQDPTVEVLPPRIDEANAVALHLLTTGGADRDLPDRFHLISYDFGGGTVDTCVLEVSLDGQLSTRYV